MSRSVTFVTLLIRPTNGYRPLSAYLEHFSHLVATGLPIVAYVDESISLDPAPNVTVVPLSRPTGRPEVQLPPGRTLPKDNEEYFWIQLEKLKCMVRAREITQTPYLAWIDFGAFHMFRDKPLATLALRRIATRTYPTTTIFAPSCWGPGSYPLWDRVCWRFCGTFLLGHRDLFPAAYAKQQALVDQHLPRLTWEVNYWCLMEEHFTLYSADHNERLLTELCHYVGPEAPGKLKTL